MDRDSAAKTGLAVMKKDDFFVTEFDREIERC